MSFVETPRFPDNIAYGSGGGPEFKTFVFEGQSGVEQRHQAWSRHRARYDVSYGIRDTTDMDTVRAFFYNMAGKAVGFRFKDWADYTLTDENIGTGDGVTTTFNITKTYTTGAETYVRRIFKPISTGFVVKVNGVTQTEGGGNDYTIDYTTGIVTFNGGSIPPNTEAVTVTGEFDVPVRFDTDRLSAAHEGFLQETWSSIPLVEIILEDA